VFPSTLAFKQPAPLIFNTVKETKRGGLPLQNRNEWSSKFKFILFYFDSKLKLILLFILKVYK
jgi:hypothetical protein